MKPARRYRRKISPGGTYTVIAQHSDPIPPGWVLRNDEIGEEITVTNTELKNAEEWQPIED